MRALLLSLIVLFSLQLRGQQDSLAMSETSLPEFTNGGVDGLNKYVADHKVYPHKAITSGTRGNTFLSCFIGADGTVGDVIVTYRCSPELDAEAVRIMKSTSGMWKPAIVDGQAVGMKITYQMVWRGPEEAGSLKSNMDKGDELLTAGKPDLAIIRFKQALEIKPNSKEAEEKLKACLGN